MSHTSTLVQSGESFYLVTGDGGQTELTEPSTVTITEDRSPRFEANKVHAIVVNSVDQPIIVDDSGIVLFLSPRAPTAAPTVAVGTAGALTGTYGVKYTFAIRDLDETIVAESGFSSAASVALTADKLAVSNLQLMPGLTAANYDDRYEVVRRVYRTLAGGAVYFLWYTVEDNTTTSFEDDTTDAAISALAADNLATVPFLSHIASFRERMFGIDDSTDRDGLLYTESGLRWAWPAINKIPVSQVKGDSQSGVTALMPRRDFLGLAKTSMFLQLTGTDETDFRLVILSTTIGCISQETASPYRDEWYFLGNDGVYKWGEDGLTCISDGRVRSWFTTDTFFNRDQFENSFGIVDPIRKVYKLAMAPAGSETFTQWVEYDIESGTWWGPHNTTYELTSAFQLSSHAPLVSFGTSDGCIAIDTDTRLDDENDVIEVEAITTPMHVIDPPVTTVWGELHVETDVQEDGSFSVYPTVGEPDDSEGTVMTKNLTVASESIGRIGYGRFLKLRFYGNTAEQIIQILGFEIDPVVVVGRRH